ESRRSEALIPTLRHPPCSNDARSLDIDVASLYCSPFGLLSVVAMDDGGFSLPV
ncbi:MAG: hypothetical protein ACI8RZ_005811, partial [Myxococcota bacterium]